MSKAIPIKKMYYFEVSSGVFNDDGKERFWWFLTTDEKKAKEVDQNYRVATVDDLDDAAFVGWKYDDFVIEVEDGYYVWFEKTYSNTLGDDNTYESGYERIELGNEFRQEKSLPH